VRATELSSLSNNLNKVIADLEKSDAQAKATAEQLRLAQAELARKDSRIAELEGERVALGKQMDQLTNSIGDLEMQIASTEQRLVSAEGDKEFLIRELKRLQTEKAELERQFNDLAVLRTQVSKLKEDLAISRRLEFIRLNLFGTAKGGAEKLMPHASRPVRPPPPPALDVEFRQDTGARVVAPTNPPPATNAAPQPSENSAPAAKPAAANTSPAPDAVPK